MGRDMEAVRRSRAKPVVRLARAAESYIAFAESSPALFRLMFSKELVDLSRQAAQAAASASFEYLAAIVSALTSPETVADLSLVAWSLVHGHALYASKPVLKDPSAVAREHSSWVASTFDESQW